MGQLQPSELSHKNSGNQQSCKARDAKVVLCVSQSNTPETGLTYLTTPNIEKISVVKLYKSKYEINNFVLVGVFFDALMPVALSHLQT